MRHDVVYDGTGLDRAGPFDDHRYAKASLVGNALLATERVIAAIGPSEDFRTVVAREHHDSVVCDTKVIDLLENFANLPIQFHHPVGIQAEAALVLPLGREMGPDMHTRGVVPEKEWLVGLHRAVHEIVGAADEFGINILHISF